MAINTKLEIIKITSIGILSAKGPNTIIERGMIAEEIILTIEKTLPYITSSTFSCRITMEGVLNSGIAAPINVIIIKYRMNILERDSIPKSTPSIPNKKHP